jgi:hypothetical protein
MSDLESSNAALELIRRQAEAGEIHVTRHALGEMTSRGISLKDVVDAVMSGEILENYPSHQRGSCCLVNGMTTKGRPLHVVCTTAQPTLIMITSYQPQMPKWKTPHERNR